ncbi:MAG: ParB/RepB/Spo0J family partition protein [Clostridia bacterium]|jgi:ParB family chromosome partitioning protein|nr:ParB/RepB/Spo0J family partition protein [Clostridia bacterium]
MATKKGMGRGLGNLFEDNTTEEFTSSGAVKMKLIDIEPNRDQPRKQFDEDALQDLANSIAQHGVLQPLLVRPLTDGTYQLVAGERRWRASRLAGLTEVPVIIRELTDSQVAELALVENLQRENLNPMETARGFKELADKFGYTQENISDIIGCSRAAVANALRLLSLSEEIQEMVFKGDISAGHARAILTANDEDYRISLAKLVVKEGLSVRETERLARKADAGEPKGKKTKKRNPYYDEVELALSDVLKRRVKVTKSSKKGSLEIEFFDDADLKKLLKIFDNE